MAFIVPDSPRPEIAVSDAQRPMLWLPVCPHCESGDVDGVPVIGPRPVPISLDVSLCRACRTSFSGTDARRWRPVR